MDKGKRPLQACGNRARLTVLHKAALDGRRSAVLLLVLLIAFAFAAGAQTALSGEYVWYRDNTFKREAYVGFLYYDEASLAMRYYAPMDAKQGLAERAIDVYITVSGKTLTGERVIGAADDEGVTIVNYLHDLYYDMSSTARDAALGGEVSPFEVRTLKTEMDAFGGEVAAELDGITPIFGVRRILGSGNEVLFESVTAGRLTSQDDKSFIAFHGFDASVSSVTGKKAAKKDKRASRKIKKGKAVDCMITSSKEGKGGSLCFVLDTQWQRSMENMWLLGEDAMVTVSVMGTLNAVDVAHYARRLVQSAGDNYIDWHSLSFDDGAGGKGKASVKGFGVKAVAVQDDGTRVFTRRVLRQSGGSWYLFTLTAFYDTYQINRTYFDNITMSIKGLGE